MALSKPSSRDSNEIPIVNSTSILTLINSDSSPCAVAPRARRKSKKDAARSGSSGLSAFHHSWPASWSEELEGSFRWPVKDRGTVLKKCEVYAASVRTPPW